MIYENGPGAAATAHRAGIVASEKPTGLDNANLDGQQSRKVAAGLAMPDNTGRKQALRLSLRAAVDAKCKSCIYDPEEGNGTWREQVQACPSANCPLHPVRPLTVKAQKAGKNAPEPSAGGFRSPDVPKPLQAEQLGRNPPISEQRRVA
jgi:hypothetical protein